MPIEFQPTPKPPICIKCGHALAGVDEPRCPACGMPFNPDDPSTYSRRTPALALIPLFAIVAFVALLVGTFLPLLGAARRTANATKNTSSLRGIAQSMAIFGNANNDYLPGLSSNGDILTGAAVQACGNDQTGASFHARLWMLLNGQCLGSDLLVSPQDTRSKWISGQNCTSNNTSYAGLQIGDSRSALTTHHHEGRAAEWKNNANSQAIMMSDRLCDAAETDDTAVRSVWSSQKGDWKGNIVWGDTHFEFSQTHKGFATRYVASVNASDNLFATTGTATASESSADPAANAMMIYY